MKRIITCLSFCTGLPRFGAVLAHRLPCARNDGRVRHHKERMARRGNPEPAFSLVELLVSLIIISLIVSAFFPILTSKLKRQNASVAAKEALKTDCFHIDNEGFCKLCVKNECIACTRSCEIGYYSDFLSCKCKKCIEGCKSCSDGYSCLNCEAGYGLEGKICTQCTEGQYSSTGICENCSNGFVDSQKTTCTLCKDKFGANCLTCNSTSCLSCTTNEYKIANNKQSCILKDPCKQQNAVLIEDLTQGIRICVSKFNAGDAEGLTIPAGLVNWKNTIASDAQGSGSHTQAICWSGDNTAGCDAANGGYSGCNRTLCTWYAADKICKYHGWRLPKNKEAALFGKYSIGKGVQGLQLCDMVGGYSSARCTDSFRCPGSYNGRCSTHNVWTSEFHADGRPYNIDIYNGALHGPGQYFPSAPEVVRCVKNAE